MKWFICSFFALVIATSCGKKSCHDQAMEDAHATALCTQDCPEVCGCDGNTYCNECIANSQGIKVVSQGPCKGK